jgi:hypothetical protein
MAYATQVTIGTGNKVSINYQSQDVSVSVTYELEREDTDVLVVAREKSGEVAAAHRIAWEHIRDEKVSQSKVNLNKHSEKIDSGTDGDEARLEAVSSEPGQAPTELPAESNVALEMEEEHTASPVPNIPLTGGQLAAIEALLVQAGWSQSQIEDHLLDQFGKAELVELSTAEATQMLLQLQREERLKTQSRSQERRTRTAHLNGHT